jgi:hypothetical protein
VNFFFFLLLASSPCPSQFLHLIFFFFSPFFISFSSSFHLLPVAFFSFFAVFFLSSILFVFFRPGQEKDGDADGRDAVVQRWTDAGAGQQLLCFAGVDEMAAGWP